MSPWSKIAALVRIGSEWRGAGSRISELRDQTFKILLGARLSRSQRACFRANFQAENVSLSCYYSVFIKKDKRLWVMGRSKLGYTFGKTLETNVLAFQANPAICIASNAIAVAGGNDHLLFVKSASENS